MKRLLTLLTLCGLAISSLAQTQQGYVKTLGRPNQKGVALSDVTIRVKGVHNTVLSKNDGRFSMQIDGDSYTLQQVQKSGYELNEPGVIGRSYAYSANVPLTLVMVSTSQLQADKQRIENKAYQVAEKNYKAKLALLEKQKEENSITIEQYRQQIQDLQDKFEKYQSLIDGLADHYAHVDYDDLDEKEREINLCIENGELEKAESLLNQLGIQQRIADIEKRLATGQGLMDEANSDMAAVLKQQEKDAEYLYQLYTIALSSYDNEKAQFLIETRAALDTTNVEWQNQAGSFIRNYIADYDKALYYYQLALRQSIEKYGEENGRTTSTYNNIGLVYSDQGDYSKAQDLFFKALAIDKKVFGLEHPELAVSYNNIGLAYYYQGDYSNALEYYYLSLSIEEKLLDIDNPSIATSYSNIGVAYKEQGNYPKALEYHFKALAIREKMLGLEHLTTAYSYHNIGIIYEDQGDKPKALEYYFKALAIFEKSLGVEHPSTATSYNSIGFVYDDQGDYPKSLEYFFKALTIREKILGMEHPSTATSYNNIGYTYDNQGNYSKALEYYFKGLAIREKVLGADHPSTASSYNNIGYAYDNQGNHSKALEYYFKALDIRERVYKSEHPAIAGSYNNIGVAYYNQGDYDKALEYYSKALKINEKVLGTDHPHTLITKEHIEMVKAKTNHTPE